MSFNTKKEYDKYYKKYITRSKNFYKKKTKKGQLSTTLNPINNVIENSKLDTIKDMIDMFSNLEFLHRKKFIDKMELSENEDITLKNIISRTNLYEELIDKIMIDEVSGIDDDVRETLLGLSTDKKRISILSILDKDRDLFKRIKRVVEDKELTQTEHIKELIEMLREYVEVGEVEQKKYGEVMTPIPTVKEMLDLLAKEVWSNPNLKWLDPCSGVGIFSAVVVDRLMEGLKEHFPSEDERYKHIMENMLYVCELQPKNMFLFMCAFDPKDNVYLNVYTGSYLDKGFDDHMKNVWNVDKFDITMMNPPYNEEFSKSGTAKDLFDKFIIKSIEISKKTISINPSRWFTKNSLKYLRDEIIGSKHLKTIKHFPNPKELFPNADITGGVSYFLYDEDYNSEEVLFDDIQVNIKKQIKVFGSILYNQSNAILSTNIIDKINKERIGSVFIPKGYFGIKTNNVPNEGNTICYYSIPQGKNCKMEMKNNRYYSNVNEYNDRKNIINDWKVMTSSSYGANPIGLGKIDIISPEEIGSESYVFFHFKTKTEAINCKTYLESNFAKFLISLKKNKQDVTKTIFELVPLLDFNEEWTDTKLYNHYNLTKEEIYFIETSI